MIIGTLRSLGATDAQVFRGVLTAYAESDFNPAAEQYGKTFGVFQQNPQWWGTKEQILDVPYATTSFYKALKPLALTDDPVRDCWRVQRWDSPDPQVDGKGFAASAETVNYVRRIKDVQPMIDNPRYFTGTG